MVQRLKCNCCKRKAFANCAETLCRLPAFVASTCPVDFKCALPKKNSHMGKGATSVFDQVITTCGNGDLCSRLLCSAINNDCLEKASNCHSCFKEKHKRDTATTTPPKPCVETIGGFMKTFPPTGETVRDLFDDAHKNPNAPWRVSEHDRHTREIQSVSCSLTMAQDHTFDVLHNHQKNLGATSLWDVATETGEIASAVLVPTTKTIHFAHAAQQLAKRPRFTPKAMCSDTCPNKSSFWPLLFDKTEGRLGLFHCVQRMMRTMRKRHIDCSAAITILLDAVHLCHSDDFEAVVTALKKGFLGEKDSHGRRHFCTPKNKPLSTTLQKTPSEDCQAGKCHDAAAGRLVRAIQSCGFTRFAACRRAIGSAKPNVTLHRGDKEGC